MHRRCEISSIDTTNLRTRIQTTLSRTVTRNNNLQDKDLLRPKRVSQTNRRQRRFDAAIKRAEKEVSRAEYVMFDTSGKEDITPQDNEVLLRMADVKSRVVEEYIPGDCTPDVCRVSFLVFVICKLEILL